MIEITPEEAQERLERSEKLPEIKRGTIWHGNGSVIKGESKPHKNLDEEQKLLIGSLGQFLPRAEIAKEFGLSLGTVHHISNGRIDSTRVDKQASKDVDFVKKLENIKGAVAERALDKLMGSLGLITSEKLEGVPVKELTEITKDLSVVVRNVSGAPGESKSNVAQVILFAPSTRKESSYEVMDVPAQVVR